MLAAPLPAAPAAAQTQAEMNAQAGAAWRSADTALNAAWPRTLAAMRQRDTGAPGQGYAAALLASQRAWLRYRDAQCAVVALEFAGGSAAPMTRLQCLAALTQERTQQLKGLMWQH